MEGARINSAKVGAPVNLVPFMMPHASYRAREEDLLPLVSNAYSLGGTLRDRISINPAHLRRAYELACLASTGQPWCDDSCYPLLHLEKDNKKGALTAQLKGCYDPSDANRYAKVVFDIDDIDATKPFPTPQQLFATCRSFLLDHTDIGDNNGADFAVVFLLSCEAKERSAHVFFPQLAFGKNETNRLGKAHTLNKLLNTLLLPFGMEADFSICNSGIRWPFGDKFASGTNNGRGCVGVPTFFGYETSPPWQWADIAQAFDPVSYSDLDDNAFHIVNWKVTLDPTPVQRRAIGQGEFPLRMVESNAPAAEQRLYERVPQLLGAIMKRYMKPQGVIKLEPQITWCPFKTSASDNQPAHQHAHPKLYVFCYPNGSAKLFCGVCQGQSISVDGPDIPAHRELAIIEKFNARFARLDADKVLQYPQRCSDGSVHPFQLLTQATFLKMEKTASAPIKTKAGKMSEAQFWYTHQHSRRFPLGLKFDPSMTCDGNYYNTFTGFNPRVVELAATFVNLTDDELGAMFENTSHMIYYNMCGGDNDSFDALIGWFRDIILQPGRKPGWGVAIFGPQGCGKGLSAQFMLKIVGKPHAVQGDSQSLTSNFNSGIVETLLIFADESVADQDEKSIAQLKKYITETEVIARRKFFDDRPVDTVMRVLCASNNNPVFLENRDRRWFCLEGKYALGNETDESWRNLCNQIVEERESLRGPAAFYALTLRHGNEGFDHLLPIRTRARWELKFSVFTIYERFVYHFLSTGIVCTRLEEDAGRTLQSIANDNNTDLQGLCELVWSGTELPKKMMYVGCLEHAKGRKEECNEAKLWQFLYKIFPEGEEAWNVHRHNKYNKVATFIMPDRNAFRAAFCQFLGQPDKIFGEWLHQ